ncbi:MAG: SNF2-related protein, partial [Prolixibacteraceae bacterium]|nr:SNF2-related protein [Prolixibacteraceae bacterium]
MHKFNHKHIEVYCHVHTMPSSFSRGVIYYKNNHIIDSAELSDDPLTIEYNVFGNSGVYDVIVTHYDDNHIETSCNCPYSGKGICKHQVAALIDFDKHDHNNLLEIPFTEDLQRATKSIPAKEFSKELVENLFRQRNILPGYMFDMRVEIKSLHHNKLKCHIYTGYWTQKHHQVIVEHQNDQLTLTCNCQLKSNDYCKHKLLTLYHLSTQEYFPLVIRSDKLKLFKQDVTKDYGMEEIISPNDFVTFSLENNTITPILPVEFIGVLPVNEELLNKSKKRNLPNQNPDINIIKPDFAERPAEESKKESKYAIGYALSSKHDDMISITPITGKLNKAGTTIISNISVYNEDNHTPVSETPIDEKIISLSKKISEKNLNRRITNKKISNNNHPDYPITREHSHFYHQYINEIIDLLSGHPHLFSYRGLAYDLYHGKLRKSDITGIELSRHKAKFFYRVAQTKFFTEIQPRVEINQNEFIPDANHQNFFSFLFFSQGNHLYAFENEHQSFELYRNIKKPQPLRIAKKHTEILLNEFLLPLAENIEVKFDNIENFEIKTMKLKPVSKRIYISGEGNFVMFKPVVEYQNEIEVEILKKGIPLKINGQTIHQQIRDAGYEEEFETFFRSLHPQFQKQFPYEFYNLKAQQMIENYWFFDAFAKLQEVGIEVYGLNELKNFRYNTNQASISTNLSSGRDWFEAKVDIAFGDNKVSLTEVRKSLIKKEKYIKLADGTIGLLPQEWLDKFERYLRAGEIKEGKIRISKTKFPLIDDLFENIKDEDVLKELSEKTQKLKSFTEIKKVKTPAGIKGTLRHYQKEGLNWLNFLHEFKWGGILADDMGLGKTLQAITFLKIISTKSKAPSLVIVPTTLIFNWQNEIEKFCPSLKALFHYGPERTKSTDHFNEYHVVITTYGHIINDISFLKDIKYNYIILDESQAIKNPASKRYKAVKVLKANNRLAMTGTPIENGTFDLYAQMSFVNPGILGSNKQFREDFSTPIDRDSDQKRAAELQKMVSPFIMRRTKEQVATELPPKTEDVIFCTMNDEQRKVYDAYRNEIRN